GNTRNLVKMLKRWQEVCNVPLKSFWLELLAIEFLESWEYKRESTIYYDWMTRDFFQFLIGKAGSFVIVPGTYEVIWLGRNWKSKAESAYRNAKEAAYDDSQGWHYVADGEWEKVFGSDVHLH
ncbi:MAG: nucleotidyltransferase, partial [Blastocatellia bacterium]|nr:nucleotidyltransferase [Blastocatellia bacterium]